MPILSALELRVPRNGTAVLQLLQRLIGRESHRFFCGGYIPSFKVPAFLDKMTDRYPAILRNARGRSYDRTRGKAAMHLIVCPPMGSYLHEPLPMLQWFLLSDGGSAGLADEKSPDFLVSRDAMSSSGHPTFGDYVLVYGTKRQPRLVSDRHSGAERTIWHQTSTWSWRIRNEIIVEVRAIIAESCRRLEFGSEPHSTHSGWGLCGLLAAQRMRPLFAGTRNQIVDLYRYAAEEAWPPFHPAWLVTHPGIARERGPQAGRLLSIRDLTKYHLPTMSQLRMYSAPPTTIRDLLQRTRVPPVQRRNGDS
jgi:hypothetical protein